jgi:hypothetical protein
LKPFFPGLVAIGALLASSVLLASGASAQDHTDAGQLLRASAGAQAAFRVDDGVVRHKATGFRCPSTHGGATLSGVSMGLPNQDAPAASYCAYARNGDVVGYLTFSPAAADEAPLTDKLCKSLPAQLKTGQDYDMPWERRYEPAGSLPPEVGALSGFTDRPVWHCSIQRPHNPRAGYVKLDITAVTVDGWIVRAIYAPMARVNLLSPPPQIFVINTDEILWSARLMSEARPGL